MKGLSMLKIKENLRLKCEAKLSNRKIARALNISHSAVNEYTKEFKLINKKYEDVKFHHVVPFFKKQYLETYLVKS